MNNEIKEILDDIKDILSNKEVYDVEIDKEVLSLLLDYITNLQQDNEMYAQLKDEYEEEIKDLQQENERIEKEWKSKLDDINMLTSRIHKAIEYIEDFQNNNRLYSKFNLRFNSDYLLDILRGTRDEQHKP